MQALCSIVYIHTLNVQFLTQLLFIICSPSLSYIYICVCVCGSWSCELYFSKLCMYFSALEIISWWWVVQHTGTLFTWTEITTSKAMIRWQAKWPLLCSMMHSAFSREFRSLLYLFPTCAGSTSSTINNYGINNSEGIQTRLQQCSSVECSNIWIKSGSRLSNPKRLHFESQISLSSCYEGHQILLTYSHRIQFRCKSANAVILRLYHYT